MAKSQKELILDYLRAHGCITPDDALRLEKRCFRLSARIKELRNDGYNIITDNQDVDGNPVNYAIYRLKEEKNA